VTGKPLLFENPLNTVTYNICGCVGHWH